VPATERHPSSDLGELITDVVRRHPAVLSVRLAGSRAVGRATEWSDWDFCLKTDQFDKLARALPELLVPLGPLAQQWDRLATHRCWMLVLPGPVKVDLVFPEVAHEPEPPWVPAANNLPAIDHHFWDWALWLFSKQAAAKNDLVSSELRKLFDHLLAPLGAAQAPASVAEAVDLYRAVRAQAEECFAVRVSRRLEAEVASFMASASGTGSIT
jgi:Nucleotidyltransferase domain